MHRHGTIERRGALLRDALTVIEADFASEISLDDVAHRVASSRRQLQRCFCELYGASFRECLTRVRMQHAAELLAGTELPVRQVAARVAYRQPAQFAKAFAKRFGATPTEYRATMTDAPDTAALVG